MADPLTWISIGSTLLGAFGQYQAGQDAAAMADAQQQAKEYEAKQMEQQAGQARASSQRQFINEKRRKDLAESKAIAINAAGGGSSLDPSVVDILGDLESEGSYNQATALYEGEDRARDLESGADMARYQGEIDHIAGLNEKRASYFKVGTTLLDGGTSMLDKYGDDGDYSTISWNDGTSGVYQNTGRYLY